jgi:Predicted transcriptional regulator
MNHIDIASLKIPGVNNTEFLVTREEGTFIRDFIIQYLKQIPENSCLFLDFKGVKFIDLSGADEIVAILASRIKSKEFGRRYVCLINTTEQHIYNIDKALKDKKLSVVVYEKGTFYPIGDINTYLRGTFDFVSKRKRATAREMADELGIPINTASTRLLNLFNEGLVIREEDVTDKGNKQFVYSTFKLN